MLIGVCSPCGRASCGIFFVYHVMLEYSRQSWWLKRQLWVKIFKLRAFKSDPDKANTKLTKSQFSRLGPPASCQLLECRHLVSNSGIILASWSACLDAKNGSRLPVVIQDIFAHFTVQKQKCTNLMQTHQKMQMLPVPLCRIFNTLHTAEFRCLMCLMVSNSSISPTLAFSHLKIQMKWSKVVPHQTTQFLMPLHGIFKTPHAAGCLMYYLMLMSRCLTIRFYHLHNHRHTTSLLCWMKQAFIIHWSTVRIAL